MEKATREVAVESYFSSTAEEGCQWWLGMVRRWSTSVFYSLGYRVLNQEEQLQSS